MNINKVQICGRLTKKPELRQTPSVEVCNFSVAVNRTYTSNGEKREEVEFVNVVAFGKTAHTIIEWFNQGDEIYVEGHMKTSKWEDKTDGKTRYKTDIILETFQFGQKSKGGKKAESDIPTIEEGEEITPSPEELPF